MDVLDVRIVSAMGPLPWSVRPRDPSDLRPAALARVVGATPETVKERLDRLEAMGVLGAYQIYPNLGHLGLKAALYVFESADPRFKEHASHGLATIDGLLRVYDLVGPMLAIDIAYRTEGELARKVQLLSAQLAGASSRRLHELPQPRVERELKRLDWRIIGALRGRARTPITEIARELHIGYRTAKRRFDRLAVEGSIAIAPLVDFGRVSGLLPVDLVLYYRPGFAQSDVNLAMKTFADRTVLTIPAMSEGTLHVGVYAATIAEAEDLRKRAAGLPNVERAAAALFRGTTENAAWLDELIAERAA